MHEDGRGHLCLFEPSVSDIWKKVTSPLGNQAFSPRDRGAGGGGGVLGGLGGLGASVSFRGTHIDVACNYRLIMI